MEPPDPPPGGFRALDLSRRGLHAVPDWVFDHAATLETLDLAGNALADLPERLGRLGRLTALFVSGNPLARLPPALGACPALAQLGARGCGLRDVPAASLPPRLRWLTLTDNALDTLPAALGACPALQKLMLAGNRLAALPEALAGAANLELLRVSANRLAALPPWLAGLPRLAWLAFAGNPFERRAPAAAAAIPWSQLAPGAFLGEGASGRIHRAVWRQAGGDRAVALKLFKGAITSDGLPASEMAAALAAGAHPHLLGALGEVAGHPEGTQGLLMPLVPAGWRVLAGPPSPASCSRDVYDPALAFGLDVVLAIAGNVASAAAHLHGVRLLHGDLYAHNTLWDGGRGRAVLTDFGAASFLPEGAGALAGLDVLAWGILLDELLDRCRDAPPASLRRLAAACRHPDPTARPALRDALDGLAVA